jgi:hypothetical protein
MATARWLILDTDFTGEGADLPYDVPDPLLLDALGVTVYQAYSTRLLREAYTGPALKVRRSSDSTTLDIGFNDEGLLDTAALLAFTGAGDGLVTKWYDQSGNAHDMAQNTTTAQPQLVISGAINTIGPGAQPGLKFGTPRNLRLAAPSVASAAASTGYSIAQVETVPVSAASGVLYGESGSATNPKWTPIYFNSSSPATQSVVLTDDAGASVSSGYPGSAIVASDGRAQASIVVDPAGAGVTAYRDGVQTGNSATWNPTSGHTFTMNVATLGGVAASATEGTISSAMVGSIGEHIMFHAGLTGPQVAALAASQRVYFGTP